MSDTVYYDYRFKFPVSGLAQALQAMAALRTAGILGAGELPENMLGDPRDATGAVNFTAPVWFGRKGIAAMSYQDDFGQTVQMPARGDPASYYIHIRSDVPPEEALSIDPADFGLTPSDPAESADLLGVWA